MNPLHANFAELFERHLCRHSQLGINVGHLLCVVVTYLSLGGLACAITSTFWPLLGVAAVYLAILAANLPARVSIVTLLCVGLMFAASVVLPPVPFWVYLIAIVVSYEVQVWSHRYWDRALDMTAFEQKYKKGFALFILLLVYELPILLNYLVFDPRECSVPSHDCAPSGPTLQPAQAPQPVS